jgi:hypothetical protein
MTTDLSEEQRKAVEQRPGALDVVDRATHTYYVLISGLKSADFSAFRAHSPPQ